MKTYSEKATMYHWRAIYHTKQGNDKTARLAYMLKWWAEYRNARERLGKANSLDKYRRRAALVRLNHCRHMWHNAALNLKTGV